MLHGYNYAPPGVQAKKVAESDTEKKGDWWYGILLIQCKGTNRLWTPLFPFQVVPSKLHLQTDVFTDLSFIEIAFIIKQLSWKKLKIGK